MQHFSSFGIGDVATRRSQRRICRLFLISILLFAGSPGTGQQAANDNSSMPDVVQFLGRTLDWYHQLAAENQIASEPSSVVILNDNRRVAEEVVRLAFDHARAEVQALPSSTGQGQEPASDSHYHALAQLSTKLDQDAKETQAEIESFRQKLTSAGAAQRKELQQHISEAQSELDLINARKEAIHSMVDFVSGSSASGLGASGLRARIEALARSVPADLSKPSSDQGGAASDLQGTAAVVAQNSTEPSGIWGLAANLFALSSKVHMLQDRIHATDDLTQAAKDRRKPLIDKLKALTKQGDQVATAADTASGSELGEQKKDLDALTAQFKQISAELLPLNKQAILLGIYNNNLANWQDTLRQRYRAELKSLLLRVTILLMVLGFVIALAEIWRKTIYRYVQEPRRRYQFLLLRKIVLWFSIAIIIAFAFAAELGSAATFAGLLTAGVAVALQNVILSIAGYFFLIGRFGVRVGDRVQVAGVTGEVVDIGLVRMHLMELGGDGVNTPTGRVVAFSNSIVFQPTAGLFKQIPGTHFVWHEIRLTLAPDSDYHAAEERLMGVVEAVFADYREEMERQYKQIERTVHSTKLPSLQPRSWVRFTASSLEVVIRYPVDLQHSVNIDDRVTRELLKAIEQMPKLQVLGSGGPTIKVSTNPTPAES